MDHGQFEAQEWTPPATMEEAEERGHTLLNEIQDLQLQLTDRNRVDPVTGERMWPEDYHLWRFTTVRALAHRQREYRALRRWIKMHNVEGGDPDRWLKEVAKTARRVLDEGLRDVVERSAHPKRDVVREGVADLDTAIRALLEHMELGED